MPLASKCWCGNAMMSEARGVATVHRCTQPHVGADRHAVVIELPDRLPLDLNGELDLLYQQLEVPLSNRIPAGVIREVGITSFRPHVDRPCLQPGCGGQLCLCDTAAGIAWVGSCGHKAAGLNSRSNRGGF